MVKGAALTGREERKVKGRKEREVKEKERGQERGKKKNREEWKCAVANINGDKRGVGYRKE